jgi:periplasmic protein TonB
MAVSVDRVLEERRLRGERSLRSGIWVSILGHSLFISALLISPLLHPQETKPFKFVSVALVSAQALGVRNPPPAAPPRREPPAPRPEPAQAEPKPEPAKPESKVTTPSPKPAKPVTQSQPAPPSAAAPAAAETLRRREGSPTGSATGTAALGARVGFDNPNFKHSYYIDRLTAMLAAQWQRPAIGGELVALVHFTIRRDGSVVSVSVVESSGYSSYDLAALRAVQQAAPFPPLPQSYTQDSLGVTVEFI